MKQVAEMFDGDISKTDERIKKESKYLKKTKIRTYIIKTLFFGGLTLSVLSNFVVPFVLEFFDVEFLAIYDINTITNGIAVGMLFVGVIVWMMSSNKNFPDMTEEEKRNLAQDDYPRGWK